VSKKKKDKESGQLAKAVAAAAKNKGISKQELKFIKDLQTAAKKGGNVTKKELAVIKKEIKKQSTDKNNIVAKSAKADPGKYLRTKVKSYGAVSNNVNQDSSESNPIMDPTPDIPRQEPVTDTVVKTPTRNVTDISSLVPQYDAEYIKKILFENLSAIELSIVERHDTIEGINQRYSIISNLSEIRKKYDIAGQLTVMDKFKPLTRIFTINIQDKIPQEDYIALEDLTATYQYLDENNEIVSREKGYYYIDTNGDLVIELIGLERNQEVEVQIDTNGTIYKIDKVES
jgi:hypothetical protein